MYGAWIGDIAGCEGQFPRTDPDKVFLFAKESHLSDSGLLTASIASAIMKSRKDQFDHGKKARTFHSFVCQEIEALCSSSSLQTDIPACVSPCGIAAVALKEAIFMARICAETIKDAESVKDAEAVAGAVFLAKLGKSKGEIRQFLAKNGYNIASSQNCISVAAACFLDSTDFEDTILRAAMINKDMRHSALMISASIAWHYYSAQNMDRKPNEQMLRIREQTEQYIPIELRIIEKDLHDVSAQRAGTYFRSGFCTSIMGKAEELAILEKEKEESKRGLCIDSENIQIPSDDVFFKPVKQKEESLIDLGSYSGSAANPASLKRVSVIDAVQYLEDHEEEYYVTAAQRVISGAHRFTPRANFLIVAIEKINERNQLNQQYKGYTIRKIIQTLEKSKDFYHHSLLRWENISPERIEILINIPEESYRPSPYPIHTIWEAKKLPEKQDERYVGSKYAFCDKSMGKTRMIIQLDQKCLWFLSIFFDNRNGELEKYSLDNEGASDSHYEFEDENAVRKLLYNDGDNDKHLEDIFIRVISQSSGYQLVHLIKPYITAQFHYD